MYNLRQLMGYSSPQSPLLYNKSASNVPLLFAFHISLVKFDVCISQ